MNAYTVEIFVLSGSGETVQFLVQNEAYPRPMLVLDQAKLEELERGAPSKETVSYVAAQITSWFENDVRDSFRANVLKTLQAQEQVRFVFRINNDIAPKLRSIPLELCHFQKQPLVNYEKVRAIVHQLPFEPTLPQTISPDYPFRVLLVRSNPKLLGGAVPPAAAIRNAILAAGAAGLGPAAVEVDLLSRGEPGAVGDPTFENFRTRVTGSKYHLFIFLGHGEKVGDDTVIKFENTTGISADPKNAEDMRMTLKGNPVPVVVLAGCVTAADAPDPAAPATTTADTLSWVRGVHGFAQALVCTDSGVQLAVGMRYKIPNTDAEKFLSAFFESLLGQTKRDDAGNVELAVKRGRERLFQGIFPPVWSAPAIFRNRASSAGDPEPIFGFLRTPAVDVLPPEDRYILGIREETWKLIATVPARDPGPGEGRPMLTLLDRFDGDLEQHAIQRGCAFLAPARLQSAAPSTPITVPVRWSNLAALQSVRLRIHVDAVADFKVSLAPALQADFELLQGSDGLVVAESKTHLVRPISAGDFVTVQFTSPPQPCACYPIRIAIEPNGLVPAVKACTAPNVVIVPPA